MENSSSVNEQLIVAVAQQAAQLNLEFQDTRRVLHDYSLAVFLEEQIKVLGAGENSSAEDILLARVAAFFYPLGFRLQPFSPQNASQTAAKRFLTEQGQSEGFITSLQQCLKQVYDKQPTTPAASLLHDALIGTYCNTETYNWANLRKMEASLLEGPTDRLAQAQLHLQELLSIRYATHAGQMHWQKAMSAQLLEQKKRVEKLLRDQDNQLTVKAHQTKAEAFLIEAGIPVRAAQTYFRAVYRNHINLSAIADNKANIMISVNAILISVLITFLSYRNIAETQPMILLPVVVFLVTGLASLTFAVLSARPKVTNVISNEKQAAANSLAFFGNFVHLSLADFEAAMNEQLSSSTLIYKSMVDDLYYLGQVLDKKYRYLSIAYNVFMVGLIVTVIFFLITLVST
ncbi:MAG: Pycsar system effector family protein [Bacteroidota bacterium]